MSFQSNSPLRFSRPRSNRAKGFALVVAISLMALTLLLMVSLSTLVRFEVQASNTAITQQMARSNALFALQAAIGQLQQHMGPDQAVSAPASLLDGDVTAGDGPDTVTGVVNPNWIGVWTYDDVPGQAAGRTTRVGNVENAVQAWLVSGADGTISPRAALTGETVELASPRNSLYDASVSHPAVTVPKVEMEEGAYAWWISDEGMKVNLSKPPLPGSSGSDLLAQVSPAVSGLTMVGSGSLETGNFGSFVTAPDDVTFARINSVEEVALAPETLQGDGFADVLDHGLHELTVSSVGLLTNTRDGGLRRDLSAMLASGAAAPDARIYSSAGAGDTGPGGPHWRQLQDFLHMADDNAYVDGTGRLIPRTPSVEGVGISPVIARLQYFHTGMIVRPDPAGDPNAYALRLYYMPALVLWNPYSLPMEPHTYYLKMQSPSTSSSTPIDVTYDLGVDGKTFAGDVNFSNLLYSGGIMRMEVRNTSGLAPGEVKAFSLGASTADKNQAYLEEGFYGEEGFFVDIPLADVDGTTDFTNRSLMLKSKTVNYAFAVTLHADTTNQDIKRIATLRRRDYSAGKTFAPAVLLDPENDRDPWRNQGESYPAAFGMVSQLVTPERQMGDYGYKGNSIHETRRPWLAQYNPASWGLYVNGVTYTDLTGSAYQYLALKNYHPLYYSSLEDQLALNSSNFQPSGLLGFSDDPNRGGVNRFVLIQIPDPELPPHSLAELQHAQLNHGYAGDDNVRPDGYVPAYAIGNSLSLAHIPLDATYATAQGDTYYDSSYLLNKALWDDYFFSSIDFSAASPTPTTHQNLRPFSDPSAATSDLYRAASGYGVQGAFNVNSTSVQAWKALLASFMGVEVETGSGNDTGADRSPVLRLNRPLDQEKAYGSTEAAASSAQGFRALSDEQVESLAVEIVRQVKTRGPFLDLASFVNRSVETAAPDELKRSGSLQAAIDAAGHGPGRDRNLNDGFDTAVSISGVYTDDASMNIPLGWGMPGFLTQADVLSRLGHLLSARSDTFRIRVYGECKDKLGKVAGSAYAEAIVQRMPEFVDAGDAPWDTPTAGSLNDQFGRRFVIVSFRWLNESEI